MSFAVKLPMYGQRENAPFGDVLDVALRAEEAGFASAYVIDHLLLPGQRFANKTDADPRKPYFLDAWTTLAAVAARTSTIRLGPQVTPIGLRHPVFVAKWAATIDRISDGRVSLGVGLGHQQIEYDSHGFPFPPFRQRYTALTEGVEVIWRLWQEEEPVTFEGQAYQIREVPFWPKPVQQRVPIWFGGASERIRHAVAAQGDGWFPAAPQSGGLGPSGAQFFGDAITAIRDEARALGRTQHIGAGALFLTMVSERQADIDRAAAMLARNPEFAGLSIDEINDRGVIIIGTPAQVVERLAPYAEAGVEEFSVSFHPLDDMAGVRRGIELYATKVMPQLR